MAPKRRGPEPDSMAANPKAARLIATLVATGAIKPDDKASKWYRHEKHGPIFAPVATSKFYTRFKKLVSEKYGESEKAAKMARLRPQTMAAGSDDDDDDGEDLDDFLVEDEEEVAAGGSGGGRPERGIPMLEFKPLSVTSLWKDPWTKDNRVSVAVLPPTEIRERPGDLKVQTLGANLKIRVVWPSVLTDFTMLSAIWLHGDGIPKLEDSHPQVQGFYTLLEQFKSRERDSIESYARIALPFPVKLDFDQHVLAWDGMAQ